MRKYVFSDEDLDLILRKNGQSFEPKEFGFFDSKYESVFITYDNYSGMFIGRTLEHSEYASVEIFDYPQELNLLFNYAYVLQKEIKNNTNLSEEFRAFCVGPKGREVIKSYLDTPLLLRTWGKRFLHIMKMHKWYLNKDTRKLVLLLRHIFPHIWWRYKFFKPIVKNDITLNSSIEKVKLSGEKFQKAMKWIYRKFSQTHEDIKFASVYRNNSKLDIAGVVYWLISELTEGTRKLKKQEKELLIKINQKHDEKLKIINDFQKFAEKENMNIKLKISEPDLLDKMLTKEVKEKIYALEK